MYCSSQKYRRQCNCILPSFDDVRINEKMMSPLNIFSQGSLFVKVSVSEQDYNLLVTSEAQSD